MKKLLYIYNPAAGRRTAKASLSDVVEVFSRQGYEITVHPTQGRGDATRTVLKDGGGFDRVVCCGGDGTLNETVQGLLALPADKRPVLGYIPAGTTNDFSRTLELPRTLPELAEVAGEGVLRDIDVGLAEGNPFTYVAAFGLFTDVSYSTPQANKNLLGHFAYLLEGMGCPGGCVAGAGTIAPIRDSMMTVEKFKNAAPSMSCTESPYLDRLEEVEQKYEITPHD